MNDGGIAKKDQHTNWLCFAMLVSNLRMIFHVSIFNENLRAMIMIIVNSIYELGPFLVVLYGLITVMSMCTFIA